MSELLGMSIDPDAAFDSHYVTMAEFSLLREKGTPVTWDWFLEAYFRRLGHPEPAGAGGLIDRGRNLWHWLLPGVAETLDALERRGIRVGVISNSDGSVAESLRRAGIGDRFEFVLGSTVVGWAKPDDPPQDPRDDTPERSVRDRRSGARRVRIRHRRTGLRAGRCWHRRNRSHHERHTAQAVSRTRHGSARRRASL